MYAAIWGLVGSLFFFLGEKIVKNATVQEFFRYALLGAPEIENPYFYSNAWVKLPLYNWERQIMFVRTPISAHADPSC